MTRHLVPASEPTRSRMPPALRWLWAENLALPIAALLVGLVELVLLRGVYLSAFGDAPTVAETTSLPLGHAVLWVTGLPGAALACAAAYRLLRHGRAWVAALVTITVCFPVMLLALAGMYGSLVLAAYL